MVDHVRDERLGLLNKQNTELMMTSNLLLHSYIIPDPNLLLLILLRWILLRYFDEIYN